MAPNGSIQWHSEAWDVLHRAMRLASYRHICMVIKFASDLPAYFVVVNFDRSNNCSY